MNKKNFWVLGFVLISCASTTGNETDFAAELQQAKAAAWNSLLKDVLDFSTLTALHYAAGWGSLPLARHILERDGQVNVREGGNRTPLFLAAGFNRPEMLEYLLQQGAELEAMNFAGSRPIHLAAGYNEDIEVLAKLIAAGADVNQANDWGSTPLHWAAGSMALPQTQLLLEHGAQLAARDKAGRTALTIAQEHSVPAESEAKKAEIAFLQAKSTRAQYEE